MGRDGFPVRVKLPLTSEEEVFLLGRETPDGDFGPATEKAVRAFQTLKSLEPDGEIGPLTWAALITE